MGFRVNTNTSAIAAQRSLTQVAQATGESTSKMASGERITKAADDAAGLAISEKMKAHIRSSKQANRNANDGVSMVQVAEGGLNESSNILTRMRELAIQAASDTVGDDERAMSGMEYEALKQELNRIAGTIEFNGKKLLNGSGSQLDFKVGVGNDNTQDQISMNTPAFNATASALGVGSVAISSKYEAQQSLGKIDGAINEISGQRSQLGSLQNRLLSSAQNLGVYTENMSASNSRIRDLDYAEEASKQARNSILSSATTAVAAQANNSPKDVLKLL